MQVVVRHIEYRWGLARTALTTHAIGQSFAITEAKVRCVARCTGDRSINGEPSVVVQSSPKSDRLFGGRIVQGNWDRRQAKRRLDFDEPSDRYYAPAARVSLRTTRCMNGGAVHGCGEKDRRMLRYITIGLIGGALEICRDNEFNSSIRLCRHGALFDPSPRQARLHV